MHGARFAALGLACLLSLPAQAEPDFPEPLGKISDFAKMLDEAAESRLLETLATLEREAGAEVAVVTVLYEGKRTAEQLAAAILEQWGVGKQRRGRGVLLLVVSKERKLAARVGRGFGAGLSEASLNAVLRGPASWKLRDKKPEEAVLVALGEIDRQLSAARDYAEATAEQQRRVAMLEETLAAAEADSTPAEPWYARDLLILSWGLLLTAALGALGFQLWYRHEELIPDRAFLGAGLGAAALPALLALLGLVPAGAALAVGGAVALLTALLGLSLWDHRCPQCQLWMDVASEPAGPAAHGARARLRKTYDCRFCGHQIVKLSSLPSFHQHAAPAPAAALRPKAQSFGLASPGSPGPLDDPVVRSRPGLPVTPPDEPGSPRPGLGRKRGGRLQR